MNPEYRNPHAISLLLLALMTMLITGSSVDMFVPSLPYISTGLHASENIVQLIVAVYLFFYGLTQLISGSVSDSFGRKATLMIGVIGFSLASFGAASSHSIVELLFFRALQGVFAAALGVATRALVTDCFIKSAVPKYASYVTFVWAGGVILSPFVGGHLQHAFGWRSNFYVLAVYACICFVVYMFFLKETAPIKHPFNIKTIASSYKTVFSCRTFILYALLCGFSYAFITIYNVMGPFLIEGRLHYSPIVYGRIALFLGIFWLCGNIIFRVFSNKASIHRLMYIVSVLSLAAAILFFVLALVFHLDFWILIILPAILFLLNGVFFTYGFGHCLAEFPSLGGSASAAAGFIYILIAAITSGFAALPKIHTMTPLATSYLALALLLLVCFVVNRRLMSWR